MLQEKGALGVAGGPLPKTPGAEGLSEPEGWPPETGFAGLERALFSLSHPSQAQSGALALLLFKEAAAIQPLALGTKCLSLWCFNFLVLPLCPQMDSGPFSPLVWTLGSTPSLRDRNRADLLPHIPPLALSPIRSLLKKAPGWMVLQAEGNSGINTQLLGTRMWGETGIHQVV